MAEFHVTWEIDIDADSPEAAAREALRIHRDASSLATVFDVTDEAGEQTRIDLTAMDGGKAAVEMTGRLTTSSTAEDAA